MKAGGLTLSPVALLALAGIAAAVVYVLARQRPGESFAAAAGAAVGGAAVDAAGGVVLGVGDAIGLPRTNETECERALREGRTWDASFACPAGTFIGAAWRELWN